jgi:redox-sensitive bicupin YhaK (pirin superfamily)
MLLGGTPIGPRHLWSTALARTPERLEQAKSDWAEGRIPSVVGEGERGNFPG